MATYALSLTALRRSIKSADAAYRRGKPHLSDAAYDALVDELRHRAPNAPELSYVTPSQPASSSAQPMQSLNNTRPGAPDSEFFDPSAIYEWHALVGRGPVAIQPKVDGVALALHYEDGTLVGANLRSGAPVDHTLLARFPSIPATLPAFVPSRLTGNHATILPASVEVRGEFFVTSDCHNPAAAASTTLRLSTAQRSDCAFLAFATPSNLDAPDEFDLLDTFDTLGFTTPYTYFASSVDEVLRLYALWRKGEVFSTLPTDGIVLRPLSLATQRHIDAAHPSTHAPKSLLAVKR